MLISSTTLPPGSRCGAVRLWALIVVCTTLAACAKKDEPVGFHPLPDLAYTQKFKEPSGEDSGTYNDFIVISNPPTD